MKIWTFAIFICSRKNCQVLKVLFLLVAILNETVKYTLKATLKSLFDFMLLLVGKPAPTHVVPTCSQAQSGPALGTVPGKSLPGLKQLLLTNPGSCPCYVAGQAWLGALSMSH